jgi:charged multivesicular body protein 2A
MMQAMKGATGVLGSMNRNMNLPALQRIAMEFEKENDIMDQRQEMMDDAIDDVTGLEDEAEGEEVVEQVLEEIGIDLRQAVSVRWLCTSADADGGDRWAKRPAGSRARLWARAEWHRRWEGVVVIPETTISRPDSTACGDERGWAMSFTRGVFVS